MKHNSEGIRAILPQKKEGALSSVVVLPDKLIFETQNPGEKVFIMLRRHIATNISWILMSLFLMFVPLGVFILIQVLKIDLNDLIDIKTTYIVAALMIWYSFLFTRSFMSFLDWYFNIYIITSERVIDFDFNPFAYHKISEAGLESIVDATQENIGFLPMLFNYGDIYIQTSGERREFDFLSVKNPTWVRDKIMDLRNLLVKTPNER